MLTKSLEYQLIAEKAETKIKHLQGWLAIVTGSWIATVLMLVYIVWAVL